jgi:hypothetical protein
MVASFDSSRAVRFDLHEGKIALADRAPQVLLPVEELLALAAGERTLRSLARAVGLAAAARAATRLAQPDAPPSSPKDLLRAASLSDVVAELGAELALLGFGNLRAETWGSALLVVLDPCSLDARGNELVEGVIEGALGLATDRELGALVAERRAGVVRLIVGEVDAIARVRPLTAAGGLFTEVIRALHGERTT